MIYFGIPEDLANDVIQTVNMLAEIADEDDIRDLLDLSLAIQTALFPGAVTIGQVDWRQKLFVVTKAAIDTGALMPDEVLALVTKVVEDGSK